MPTSSRTRAASPGLVPGPDGWSRFVSAAKLALPLAAVALLSSLFLVASRPGAGPAPPPLATGTADAERVGAPRFAGVTDDGDAVALSASAARPDPDAPGILIAETVEALVDGGARKLALRAPLGRIGREEVTVSGGVRIGTSDGWDLAAPRVTAALGRTQVAADGPLSGVGPLGTVTAGALAMTADRLVLSGGVRVLYDPAAPRRPPHGAAP